MPVLAVFSREAGDESSSDSESKSKADVQEWMTRLIVLLMTNMGVDDSSDGETRKSSFFQIVDACQKRS